MSPKFDSDEFDTQVDSRLIFVLIPMLNFQKHAWPSISGYVASTLQVNFNHNKYKKDPVFKSKSTLTNSVLNLSWRTASVTTSTEKKTKMTVIHSEV